MLRTGRRIYRYNCFLYIIKMAEETLFINEKVLANNIVYHLIPFYFVQSSEYSLQ